MGRTISDPRTTTNHVDEVRGPGPLLECWPGKEDGTVRYSSSAFALQNYPRFLGRITARLTEKYVSKWRIIRASKKYEL